MNALIDKYSKDELEAIVKSSNSLVEVIDKLGYSTHGGSNNTTVKKRIEQYSIDTSHFKSVKTVERNEENIFIENSTASQQTLRRWYIKGEYTPYICSICGQPPKWQGKSLTLILDHINGSNHDNRLENLRWVCPNYNQQLDTTGFKKMRTTQNLKKKYYCIDCGKEISHGATRCLACANKEHAKNSTMSLITREELKQLIRTIPFTQIATKYGVTDNAVRKWCDKYSLPRKKSDINTYSDEEWLKI